MSGMLSMGGYGVYVWSSFGLFVAVLAWDAASPWIRQRTLLRLLRQRRQRETARAKQT